MELRNLTNNPTDYLDAFCEAKLGHTNWAFVDCEDDVHDGMDVIYTVVFFNELEEAHEDA